MFINTAKYVTRQCVGREETATIIEQINSRFLYNEKNLFTSNYSRRVADGFLFER